ncbi:hypothetical protein [Natronolimnobius baerhuensis]|uniref:Uncharacterized protein n=1 Tax=Natronolimnobius baerhuensis TaxID=253108 RepID=A0A202E4F9_9EURY|nr:hypothetical protein [Natronolimnobius baerhuensis]OVE83173.1 hypothetical protein B2G88_17340 [Natronolimnobius baerhuensis]
MNSDDARALTALLEAVEEAGGDVRDVDMSTCSVIQPGNVFATGPRPKETIFTLEVTTGDLLGNPMEASDADVSDAVGIDVDSNRGDA